MLSNITLGKYINQYSRVHEMHPLSKIICTLLFIIAVLITNDKILLITFTLCLLILIVLSNINYKYFIKPLISFYLLITFIFLISLISGVELALINAAKTILIIEYIILLISTTQLSENAYALSIMFSSLKIVKLKTNNIALNISLALCFIPIYMSEKENTKEKYNYQTARQLLHNTKQKLKTIKINMEIRGYSLEEYRTSLKEFSWQLFDTCLIFGHLLVVVLLIKEGGILWDI